MRTVKKLAGVGGLPYALVSDVRSVHPCPPQRQETARRWTSFVILGILWLLGVVASLILGGFIPLLMMLAVVVLVRCLRQGWPLAARHELGMAERQRASE